MRQRQQLLGGRCPQRTFTLVVQTRWLKHHHANICTMAICHGLPSLNIARHFMNTDLRNAGHDRLFGQYQRLRKSAATRLASQHLVAEHARGSRHNKARL